MTLNRSLSAEKRHQIALIREALGKSDGHLHRYMLGLDQLDRSAKQDPTRDVSSQQVRILDNIHDELLRALQRLGALNTGLRAQEDLRKALIDAAAGYAAWSFALGSRNLTEITNARARVQRHFDAAADYGERGTSRLERGT
jgi:hypothetical protein